jgi:hypothetical protein
VMERLTVNVKCEDLMNNRTTTTWPFAARPG